MTHGTISRKIRIQAVRLTGWIVLLTLLLTMTGHAPDSLSGWVTHPPSRCVVLSIPSRRRRRFTKQDEPAWNEAWVVLRATVPLVVVQTVVLAMILYGNEPYGWFWVLLGVPLLRWVLHGLRRAWPRWVSARLWRPLDYGLFRIQQMTLLVGGLLLLRQWMEYDLLDGMLSSSAIAAPLVMGRILDDGTYEIHFGDQFVMRHRPVDETDKRLFLLFARTIYCNDRPNPRPLFSQQWLADHFNVLQEHISRWHGYHQRGAWDTMQGKKPRVSLSEADRATILSLWSRHIWWSVAEATTQCQEHGISVTVSLMEDIGRESGLLVVRRTLREQFHLSAESLRPKEAWLVQHLSALVDDLQQQVEQGGGGVHEEPIAQTDVQQLCEELGIPAAQASEKPLPWGYRLQQVLLGQWSTLDDETIRCPHCGSSQVGRKSATPRMKRYLDAQGQEQEVAVYRYYCRNSVCPHQTFTNLPPDLLPYSRHRAAMRAVAVQVYAYGRERYRSATAALGVSQATVYRWVTVGGTALLPIGQLFGVVRSSGVLGVDEKWAKVLKNENADGKHSHWMYVYMAVDVWTYDLVHIAILPKTGKDSARLFLQEVRAKGYRPQVIVTDLSPDYPDAIAQVFPQATHHLCVFHALKAWHATFRSVYGKDYQTKVPTAYALQQQIDAIFRAKTKRTAERRYAQVLAQRERTVQAQPGMATVFDSLERHWPKLVNAIESPTIPLTNNATELVNRRFDQHYQNFCGFQSRETAQKYLAVFERTYRLTPFTQDAQQRVRGRCPLELAGYDVSKIPLVVYFQDHPPPGVGGVSGGKEVVPTM